jgi:hypothetical protein
MIQHIVMMKFDPGVGDAEIDALEAAMDALPNKITEIYTYEFGRDVVHSERSYDFALVSTFANLETLKAYQTHPEHIKLLAMLKPMCASILAVDFEVEAGATRGAEPPPAF